MRMRDWSSDVCSSDLRGFPIGGGRQVAVEQRAFLAVNRLGRPAPCLRDVDQSAMQRPILGQPRQVNERLRPGRRVAPAEQDRPEKPFEPGAEERRADVQTSEIKALMRNTHAVFCLTKKKDT